MSSANPMGIFLVGISHRTAPVELRERLAFGEASLLEAKGDSVHHTFEYRIALSEGKQYDCPACGSHLIFESDVADLKNTFGLTEPDFDLMLSREKR